jgi:hypothetical protein
MAEETPEIPKDAESSTPELPESAAAAPAQASEPPEVTESTKASEANEAAITSELAAAEVTETAGPKEPDAVQPFIDKVFETIAHEVDDEKVELFLRTHIKTFREEWDALSDTAKDAYVHMMASQLVQRKAAATRIQIYQAFNLPVPSAQTILFESLKQSQIKPQKRQPVLLMPPNLRPTSSQKR